MKLTILLTAVCLTLAACANSQKINKVSLGMTKDQVIAVMGAPTSTSAKTGVEYMTYALYETDQAAKYGFSTPFFVKIIDGKVDAFGRVGDFGNGKPAGQTVNLNVKTSAAE